MNRRTDLGGLRQYIQVIEVYGCDGGGFGSTYEVFLRAYHQLRVVMVVTVTISTKKGKKEL